MTRNPRIALGGGLAAVLLSSTALAQTAQPATSPTTSPNTLASTQLTEVVVTAQKRRERLQDVPIAVSTLSAAALASENVHSLQDLTARVPSFVATNSAGYGGAPLSIRGVGGANGGGLFFSDEPVATYIDGVYIARLSVATSDLVDIDNLQVLRGPQGSLYGRNSTAGALVITTNRPTKDVQGGANASADSLGDYRGEAFLSGPIAGEKVLGRLAVAYSDLGGFGTNVLDGGKTVNNGHDTTVRGSVRLSPVESVTIDLIAEHFDQHFQPGLFRVAKLTGGSTDSPFVLRPDFTQAMDNSQYEANENVNNHIRTDSLTGVFEWKPEAFVLNSTTAYRSFEVNGLADSDNAAPADLTAFPGLRSYNDARVRNRQLSEDLRIGSPGGPHRLNWTGGLYYLHENNSVDPFEIYNNGAYFHLGTDATFHAFQSSDAAAAYLDGSYEVLKGLTLRLGGRYSWEEKNFQNTQHVQTILGGFSPAVGHVVPAGYAVAAPPTYYSKADFHNLSGRAVLDYKLYKDILLYASLSQGFKSGGFNAFGLTPAFQPERINSYETGVKSELFNHRLRINADAFEYFYSNLQVRLPVPTGGVNVQNAASAHVKGVEFETAFTPVRGLKFGFNSTYLDAHYVHGSLPEVPPNATFSFGANIPLTTVSIAGNTMSRAPRWQAGLTGDYEHYVAHEMKASIGLNYRFQSNEFFLDTNQNAPTFRSGAWDELGLHATLAQVSDRWSVTAYGENILDNRHLTQVTPLSAFPYGTLNLPARYGVRVGTRF
jgi:iron complex outermembrane receptor protein